MCVGVVCSYLWWVFVGSGHSSRDGFCMLDRRHRPACGRRLGVATGESFNMGGIRWSIFC